MNCVVCNTEIILNKQKVRKFCSKLCKTKFFNKWENKPYLDRICKLCRKEFKTKSYRVRKWCRKLGISDKSKYYWKGR